MEAVDAPPPLAGVRVVELGTVVAGPFAGSLLADLGADVIKVEPEGGDVLRRLGPGVNGVQLWWGISSRDKRCVALDLKSKAGLTDLRALLSQADILVSNYRPGVLDRLGLGAADLAELNPQLIHACISGFGAPGRDAQRPGFGKIAEGMSGLAQLTGCPDDQPLFCGFSHADTMTGLFATMGAVFALYGRDHCNRRLGLVDVALYEPLMRCIETQFANLTEMGRPPSRQGRNDPYGFGREDAPGRTVCVRSREGVWLGIYLPDVASTAACLTAVRSESAEILSTALTSWCANHSSHDIFRILSNHGAFVSPVYDGLTAATDRYFRARGDVQWTNDSAVGALATPGHVEPRTRADGRHLFRSAELEKTCPTWRSPRVTPPPSGGAPSDGPLFRNLVVLEISETPGAAFCATLFAEFGASVMVCEPVGGTALRHASPHLWASLGRNKRSLVVSSEREALFDALFARSDVVITDFPQRKWAAHPFLSRLADDNRALVATVHPTGADHPEHWPWSSHAALAGAGSGLMAITGKSDGPPLLPEAPVIDYAAGALAALRLVARLWRNPGGREIVAEPLHRAMQRMIEWQFPVATALGEAPQREGNNFPMNMGIGQMCRTRDGRYVTISAVNDAVVARLLALVGGDELVNDPRFASPEARSRHAPEVFEQLASWVAAMTADELIATAIAHDVVAGVVYDALDIAEDEHVRERGSLIDLLCDGVVMRVPQPVPRIPGAEAVVRHSGPGLDDGFAEALGLARTAPGLDPRIAIADALSTPTPLDRVRS